MKKRTHLFFSVFAGFFLVGAAVGCTASFFSSRGSLVQQQNRIALKEKGSQEGIWQTRDLQIEYAVLREKNRLSLSGTVLLDRYLTTGFSILEHLFLDLYLLDDQGRVIETKRVKNFGYRRWIPIDKMIFESVASIPEGAVSFSFGYHGRVMEGGRSGSADDDSGGTTWEFWEVPK